MQGKLRQLWTLFTTSLYISTMLMGGGYVAVPLFMSQFVEKRRWVDKDAMMDLIVIAQAAPGAIVVNLAVSVGYRLAGFPGVFVSLFGTVLPPLVFIAIIQGCYAMFIENTALHAAFRGMNAAMVAVMINAVFDLGREAIRCHKIRSLILMALVFSLVFLLHINAVTVMAVCIVLSLLAAGTQKFFTQREKNLT